MPTVIGIAKYKQLLGKLFPIGKAWERVKEHVLLAGLAVEFNRVEERASDLVNIEFSPYTTTELLPDWEQLLGLPDECTPEGLSIDERRAQVVQKLATRGGASAAYFEQLATKFGFNAIVTDYRQFEVGRSRVGEPLSNHFDHKFRVGENRVGDVLRNTGWQYWFNVDVEATNLRKFRVGMNRVGEALVLASNPLFECTVRRLKPAHTAVFFTFRAP